MKYRKLIILSIIFAIVHVAIFFGFSTVNPALEVGFIQSIPNTLFLFLYIGLLPIVFSFVIIFLLKKKIFYLQKNVYADDGGFILLLVAFSVLIFFVYGELGMLAA